MKKLDEAEEEKEGINNAARNAPGKIGNIQQNFLYIYTDIILWYNWGKSYQKSKRKQRLLF